MFVFDYEYVVSRLRKHTFYLLLSSVFAIHNLTRDKKSSLGSQLYAG